MSTFDTTQIRELAENKWVQMSVVGICTFGLGYILGKRNGNIYIKEVVAGSPEDPQMALDFTREAEESPTPMFDELPDRIVQADDPDEEEIDIEEYEQALDEALDEPGIDEDPEESEVHNVFNHDKDSYWSYQVEEANRNPDEPYIIHQDEFINNEMGLPQSTLTYYDGDNVLTSEDDVPVYNHEKVVGDLRWGHGSNDPNVVYIRNEKMRAEYEILLFNGYFEREVLGLYEEEEIQNEIRHSQSNQRFRRDD